MMYLRFTTRTPFIAVPQKEEEYKNMALGLLKSPEPEEAGSGSADSESEYEICAEDSDDDSHNSFGERGGTPDILNNSYDGAYVGPSTGVQLAEPATDGGGAEGDEQVNCRGLIKRLFKIFKGNVTYPHNRVRFKVKCLVTKNVHMCYSNKCY